MSNAADKSNSSKATVGRWSMAFRMSLWTFRRAVSVLCSDLYADWSGSSRSLLSTCSMSWKETAFSITFETKAKFDTGLRFLKISSSRFAFFSRGRICAIFNISGMIAQSKERFTISVMTGRITGQHSFNTKCTNQLHMYTRGQPVIFLLYERMLSQPWHHLLGWFSNRTGTSDDDGRARGMVWILF